MSILKSQHYEKVLAKKIIASQSSNVVEKLENSFEYILMYMKSPFHSGSDKEKFLKRELKHLMDELTNQESTRGSKDV